MTAPKGALMGIVRRSWFRRNHNCPFLAPRETTRKSAWLELTISIMLSWLISSTVPKPGSIDPTQFKPAGSTFSVLAAAAATLAAPPNRKIVNRRRSEAFRASKISDPLILSLIGMPVSRAIQTIGIPSAGQRSLSRIDSLNSESDRLVASQLRLGVEMRKDALLT